MRTRDTNDIYDCDHILYSIEKKIKTPMWNNKTHYSSTSDPYIKNAYVTIL